MIVLVAITKLAISISCTMRVVLNKAVRKNLYRSPEPIIFDITLGIETNIESVKARITNAKDSPTKGLVILRNIKVI